MFYWNWCEQMCITNHIWLNLYKVLYNHQLFIQPLVFTFTSVLYVNYFSDSLGGYLVILCIVRSNKATIQVRQEAFHLCDFKYSENENPSQRGWFISLTNNLPANWTADLMPAAHISSISPPTVDSCSSDFVRWTSKPWTI